jgi:hypothetical protein
MTVLPFPKDDTDKKIYHFKRAGLSFEEIAERLELTVPDAIRGYRAYMVDMVSEYSLQERDHIIAMELARLDEMMIPFYVQGTEGDKEGAEVTLKIMAQRMKLLRLDQPSPDELAKTTQVIVVTGGKEDYERALRAGREQYQVTGRAGENGDEEEA